MKEILFSIVFVALMLSACDSTQADLRKIESVPQKIEENINDDVRLQLINKDSKGSYMIFHSKGDARLDLETQDNVVYIKISELNVQDDIKRNVYYVQTGSEHDSIAFLLNDVEIPIDEITILE